MAADAAGLALAGAEPEAAGFAGADAAGLLLAAAETETTAGADAAALGFAAAALAGGAEILGDATGALPHAARKAADMAKESESPLSKLFPLEDWTAYEPVYVPKAL